MFWIQSESSSIVCFSLKKKKKVNRGNSGVADRLFRCSAHKCERKEVVLCRFESGLFVCWLYDLSLEAVKKNSLIGVERGVGAVILARTVLKQDVDNVEVLRCSGVDQRYATIGVLGIDVGAVLEKPGKEKNKNEQRNIQTGLMSTKEVINQRKQENDRFLLFRTASSSLCANTCAHCELTRT